jgi:hypothetical protein
MTSKELKEKKEYLQNQYENKKTIIISINVDILIELIENQERLEEENAKLKQAIRTFLKYYKVNLYDEDGLGSCEIGVETIGEEFYISKEEYELLKEVFENES